jgi:hypothetical protein
VQAAVKKGFRTPGQLLSILQDNVVFDFLQATHASQQTTSAVAGHAMRFSGGGSGSASLPLRVTLRTAEFARKRKPQLDKLGITGAGSAQAGINWRKEALIFAGSITLMAAVEAAMNPHEVWDELVELEHMAVELEHDIGINRPVHESGGVAGGIGTGTGTTAHVPMHQQLAEIAQRLERIEVQRQLTTARLQAMDAQVQTVELELGMGS